MVSALLLASSSYASVPDRGGCAPTVEAAVESFPAKASVADSRGFRVEDVRVDRIHGRAWAIVGDCSDVARPRVAVALRHMDLAALTEQVAVHAGEHVLIQADGASRMELRGTAKESGAIGKEIGVRLEAGLFGDAQDAAELHGRVVKAGVVEMIR